MKAALILIIQFYLLFSTYGRLMHKTTDAPKLKDLEDVEDTQTSKEEKDHNLGEYFKFYNRKVRMVKESNIKVEKVKNTTNLKVKVNKPKAVLVKKPIPKYHDAESDEDYQAKLKMPLKLSDSAEHEDEDFNVDDYDFDVNHDEYAGRGKPLEPRIKIKLNRQQMHRAEPKGNTQIPKIAEDLSSPAKLKVIVPRKIADKMKEEEYDDEFESKTTESSTRMTTPDESSDENEESIEYKGSVRTARSPWNLRDYVSKLGEKSSGFMTKILSILPIFPQQPSARRLDEEMSLMRQSMLKKRKI